VPRRKKAEAGLSPSIWSKASLTYKNKAYERKAADKGSGVNVLIMANNMNSNNQEISKEANVTGEKNFVDESFDEIDLTNSADSSDSELDINELLKKYMPEYTEPEEEKKATTGGVLSRIKESAAEDRDDDEKLMDALDSVFSFPGDQETEETYAEEYPADDAAEETFDEELDDQSYDESYDEAYDEYEDEYDDSYEYNENDIFEDPFAEDEPKKKGFFAKLKEKLAANKAAKQAKKEQKQAERDLYEAEEEYTDDYSEEYGEEYEEEYDEQYAEEFAEEYAEQFGEELVGEYAEQFDEQYAEEFAEENAEQFDEQYAEEYTEAYAEEIAEETAETTEEFAEEAETFDELDEFADVVELVNFAADNEPAEAPAATEAVETVESAEENPIDEYAELFGDDTFGFSEDVAEDTTEEITDSEVAENEIDEEDQKAIEQILDEEFDPTDINLMVAFGLDNGDDDKADRAKAFGDKLVEKQKNRESKKFKLDRPEFVDKTQIPQIRAEYKKKTTSLWIRLGACGVLSFLLLIFENMATITKLFTGTEQQFAGAFDPQVYPIVYAMVSLQLMLLACLCALEQIVDGFKCLFNGTPKPETITSLLTVCGILYSAIVPRLVVSPEEPAMFNFVVALSAFLALVYAMFNHKREMMNFRIIANKRPKHIVRRLGAEESECETKAFADADDICDVMKIEKTDFIDGFFARLSKPDATTNTFITFLVSITAALAALIGIFAAFKGSSAAEVGEVIFSSMLILIPMSVFLTFSYPFYRANLSAKEHDSAIIGETSLEEYSNASIISFDDKNVFPSYSVKVQNIRIYNNARIDRVLYYASSVFAYAGGPLQDVFEVATKEMGNSQNVQIFDVEDGFLATQVDGVNIIFGSCEALTERGLEIPQSAAEDDVDLSDELSIMYMFRESKLVAKMYIQYVMDADIDLILKQYSGSGLYVCVRTFDPNINERMIARKLNLRRIPLKIIRYADADEVGSYEEKVDSGLVTCASPKSLLQVISYCGKVLHTKKTNIAMSTLSIMIGVAILALLLITNATGIVNSLFIALYQLIWIIPMAISARMFVR